MTEPNKFQCVDTINLYDDDIGRVSLYDASHANESEEQRIWTVSTLASLAYGNEEAKNPEALYQRLQTLKHESLWEFIRDGMDETSTIYGSARNYFKYENPNDPISEYLYGHYIEHKQNIACFRIKVPIFVARQFMRHRSFSYLEMSRRYTKDSKVSFEFWFPKYFHGNKIMFEAAWMQDYDAMSTQYDTQIASRFLPQTTYTEFYVMGEVEGLRNYFSLRCKKDAQEQTRELSMAMLQLLAKHQPELYQKVLP